ncbi:MAG: amidohydrolase [Bacteroidota bacterium]
MNRKSFVHHALGTIGTGVLASILPNSVLATGNETGEEKSSFFLKNVKLETGFTKDDLEVTATQTALFNIQIENGLFKKISKQHGTDKAIDANENLMLPSTKDMHIHLDKTYYGGPWKAKSLRQKSVKDMIALEQKILPEMLKTSTYRAEKLIELLQSKGTDFARSHVNIEPTSQLQSLKNLQIAIENKKSSFGVEIVAFPQHGVYYTKSDQLLKEAAQMDIDFIGGVDPFTIDGSIERTIDFTVQTALDYNKGIDIHLHEMGPSGVETIKYLIAKVNENPGLMGKTYISHCFALSTLQGDDLTAIIEKLANAKIGIVSTIPIGKIYMPIPQLIKGGVNVMTGTDCVVDHWQPFGTGSMIQKANRMAEMYGKSDEYSLSRCLKIATRGLTPLDDDGKMQWPKVGDKADFILLSAASSAEVVARNTPVNALFRGGKKVYQALQA